MSASRIPTGTLLRFARDTPYQRTAVVLKDQSVLQVKNVENPNESRQHFVSVEEWLLHTEDNTRCEYLDQTLNVENLKLKIDDYVSLDAYEDECDCASDCDSEADSEADSECSWDSDAESEDDEEDNESVENLEYNRNTRTRTATPAKQVKQANHSGRNVVEVRRSGRLANKPRVDYSEIADDVPHATRTHIGQARVEQVRAAKQNSSSGINQKYIDNLKKSVDHLQNVYNARQAALQTPMKNWMNLVKSVYDEMKGNGTYTTYKAVLEEAMRRKNAAKANTSNNSSNPFMAVYTEVLREARASGKKIDYKNVAIEARSRYEASKKRA
jgi:hypothetical protein